MLLVYRDEYYHPYNSPDFGIAEIAVAKNCHGPVDRVTLAFMSHYGRFRDLPRT